MHIPSKRLTGIKGENFTAEIEYGDNLIAIHLPYVGKFDRSTFLEMKFMLEDWNAFFKSRGYQDTHAAFDPSNLKLKKLVGMLGFEYIIDHDGFSIYRYVGE